MAGSSSLEFDEIAQLINASRSTTIDTSPRQERQGSWALFSAGHKVHTSTYPFEILYLHSRAKKEDLVEAARTVFRTGDTHVVYASSLDQRTRTHHELFEGQAHGFWTTREYLASFLRSELDSYIGELKRLRPRFYVDPQFATPSGVVRKTPNPILDFLRDENDFGKGKVAVLLAEPGQGKTYQSQHLASTLATFDVIPIYIDSKQWSTMSIEELRSVHKTVAHSFRSFNSPIAWLEGREEEFLRVTLKANLFRIIFDGFDEYVLWNQGHLQASEALAALVDLAAETQSRIVLTSRTSFWHAHIESSGNGVSDACYVYGIRPFEQQQARGYFDQRFASDSRASQAVSIYSELAKTGNEFLGRGFVLSLVADLVETPDITAPALTPRSGFNWILEALCERETRRQQLPVSGAEQLEAFRLFALDCAAGTEPSTLALQMALLTVSPSLTEHALSSSIEKLANHPLLRVTSDRWEWVERQIGLVLLANSLLDLVPGDPNKRTSTNLGWLRRFGRVGTPSNEELDSLAAMAVDLGRMRWPKDTFESMMVTLVKRLRSVDDPFQGATPIIRLAFELALRSLEQPNWKSSSLEERTKGLLCFLGDSPVTKWAIHGALSRFDLRHLRFEDCRFDQTFWSKVKFDGSTEFVNCRFSGGGSVNCEGFGLARIVGGSRDTEAESFIRREQISAGKKRYAAEDLKADIRSAVLKFANSSATGFRTLKSTSLKSGTFGHSRHRDEIVAQLERSVIQSITISGVTGGGYKVRPEAEESIRFIAQNNVLTGPLKDSFERLKQSLNTIG